MSIRNLASRALIGMVGIMLLSAGAASADDHSPKVDTSQPTPVVYPLTAQTAGEEGTVVLRVRVNDDGRPAQADVARSSGYPDLDNAAVETALNWRYVPAVRDGAVTADWAAVQVVYKLPETQQHASVSNR